MREHALSNDVGVSGPAEGETPAGGADGRDDGGAGVLSNLPRTRPQRATARRAAAREHGGATSANGARANGSRAAAGTAGKKNKPAKPASKRTKAASAKSAGNAAKAGRASDGAPRTRRSAPKRQVPRAVREEVPRQGFETEDERATGAVPPPGTADVLSTAVEALGEIAKAGIAGSERLLRDVFSRLGR
jgi:hypothetical protein